MLSTFKSVSPYFKPKQVKVDNLIFRLHYRWTFLILVVATVLVTSRQYIGEHIKCIEQSGKPLEHVIETYCFFTTTFTLLHHNNLTAVEKGIVPHPGVGPFQYEEDPIKRHAYYQWVPFILFGQALLFYIPHYFWKKWEGGKIFNLVNGLRIVKLSKYVKEDFKLENKTKIFSKKTLDKKTETITIAFKNHLKINSLFGPKMILCEIMNVLNIFLQVYMTNSFLGGLFLSLGPAFLNETWDHKMDALDIIFPKVTKCSFYKYGPSGGIQLHDALCILALNVINEKIYTFLWFWFLFLSILSFLSIVWRIFTLFMHKNPAFNQFVFSYASPGRLNQDDIEIVTKRINFSNWMFLYYLACNLSGHIFRDVLNHLANEFHTENSDGNDDQYNGDYKSGLNLNEQNEKQPLYGEYSSSADKLNINIQNEKQ
ncbi:innexin inx7 [Condylostylus longicornis]|uniref:innexin inx7 n=1 Tax=Condylostylus longicornis TaxID=2530218 RepID=UPI00244E001A|nr:innexin inx7 [Condylostylus longicornis]